MEDLLSFNMFTPNVISRELVIGYNNITMSIFLESLDLRKETSKSSRVFSNSLDGFQCLYSRLGGESGGEGSRNNPLQRETKEYKKRKNSVSE